MYKLEQGVKNSGAGQSALSMDLEIEYQPADNRGDIYQGIRRLDRVEHSVSGGED